MALKELKKTTQLKTAKKQEAKIKNFISKGGTLSLEALEEIEGDHRLTLRIPKFLMDKVDMARKKRIGKISRNLWILEIIQKATEKQ